MRERVRERDTDRKRGGVRQRQREGDRDRGRETDRERCQIKEKHNTYKELDCKKRKKLRLKKLTVEVVCWLYSASMRCSLPLVSSRIS